MGQNKSIIAFLSLFWFAACCFSKNIEQSGSDISYWLYTRELGQFPFELKESTLSAAPLVKDEALIVILHGYDAHKDFSPNMELRPAFLGYGDYNLISVDYAKLVMSPNYLRAAINVDLIGIHVADFLKRLYSVKGQSWFPRTRLVGFSLGAHIAGIVGKNLPGLPRITGLDPALPLFSEWSAKSDSSLDLNDAQFVDVYHSNGGWKGRLNSLGHIDFYLNNGGNQPGCRSNSSCDHVRAVEVFAESISSREFWGVPCKVNIISFLVGISSEVCTIIDEKIKNQILAGEHVDHRLRGTFQISTNAAPPYARGKFRASKIRKMKLTTLISADSN